MATRIMKKTVLNKIIFELCSAIFLLCALWIFVIVMLFGHLDIPDWVRMTFLLPNYILLPVGICYACLIHKVAGNKQIPVGTISIVAFIFLCIGSYFCYIVTGWDAGTVAHIAWKAALNGTIEVPQGYYSFYTNNILIHCLEYFVFKICITLGISSFENALYALILLNCAVTAFSSLFVYDILKMLYSADNSVANLGFFFYLGIVFLSPWVLIVYTDALALIMPIFTIWLYLIAKNKDRKLWESFAYCAVLAVTGYLSYRLKATAFVAFIAVFFTELVSLLNEFSAAAKRTTCKALAYLVILVICFLASEKVFVQTYTSARVVLDKEFACPFTHYLKMGFNNENAGTFDPKESEESMYISSYSDRYEHDLSKAKSRIKSLLPFEIFRFEARKTLLNYHDGSFSNGIEGNFYPQNDHDRDSFMSLFLKSIFWTDGKYYPYLKTFFQFQWLAVLFFGIFFRTDSKDYGEMLVKVTLIGLFLFLALFESRARYVYIYIPLYLIAFSGGFIRVAEKWRKCFG